MLDVRASVYLSFFAMKMVMELGTMIQLLFWRKSVALLVLTGILVEMAGHGLFHVVGKERR